MFCIFVIIIRKQWRNIMGIRDHLKKAHRVVVKVGTSTITYPNRKPNLMRMEKLVREIVGLSNEGYEMVLVT